MKHRKDCETALRGKERFYSKKGFIQILLLLSALSVMCAMCAMSASYSWRDPLCHFGMTPFVEVGSALVDSVTHFVEVVTHSVDSVTHFVDME